MINSNKILYSSWKNDECFTPWYWVKPIIKYIEQFINIWRHENYLWIENDLITIWCPFDKEDSEFVKQFKVAWFNVIYSHIDTWQDFFNYEPKSWDIIISNPPFTNKRKYFERALSFKKPFALIMTNTWLNDSAPKKLFKEHDLQLLMFDKRMKFKNHGVVNNKITFSSSYYCYNFLPKQIIMEDLKEHD